MDNYDLDICGIERSIYFYDGLHKRSDEGKIVDNHKAWYMVMHLAGRGNFWHTLAYVISFEKIEETRMIIEDVSFTDEENEVHQIKKINLNLCFDDKMFIIKYEV